MTEHTHGPWKIISRHPGFVSFRGGLPSLPIGDINIYSDFKEEGEANLALTLAAPDLLEALEFIVSDYPEPGEDAELTVNGYNKACKAIAKAKEVTP